MSGRGRPYRRRAAPARLGPPHQPPPRRAASPRRRGRSTRSPSPAATTTPSNDDDDDEIDSDSEEVGWTPEDEAKYGLALGGEDVDSDSEEVGWTEEDERKYGLSFSAAQLHQNAAGRQSMLIQLLKASRPGWWLVTFWMYVLPTSQMPQVVGTTNFWLGLLYCTLPLNMLVYVWNDFADFRYDQKNLRKDSYLYGARASEAQLAALLRWAFWLQLPCALALTVADNYRGFSEASWTPGTGDSMRMVWWFLVCVGVNGLYNHPIPRFSERPPFDLLSPVGYLGVGVLSSWLNRTPAPSSFFWYYNCFLVLQTQLWAQLVDINVDQSAGRRTSAVILGQAKTRFLLGCILLAELAYVCKNTDDICLRAFTCLGIALPVISTAVPTEDKKGTEMARKLHVLGYVMNTGGVGLMAWCWSNATFA